jgi:hypothetical protein
MRILTRSRRLRGLVTSVLRQIPSDDRSVIMRFLLWVQTDTNWSTVEVGDEINETAGGLYPLWGVGGDPLIYDAQIRFSLPVCRLFSERALRGIIAHEFAHALRAARLGPGWHERMQRRWRREDQEADAIVMRWGFRQEIAAKDRERRTQVTPTIHARSRDILRRIANRRKMMAQTWLNR